MARRKGREAQGYRPYHGKKRPGRTLPIVLLTLALLAALTLAYAHFIEPRRLRTETFTVRSARLTAPLRVAAVADLHIGRDCGPDRVKQVMDAVAALEPDAVVFLGDLFDDYSKYRAGDEEELAALLALPALPDVPKYAVWGNHDLGGGAAEAFSALLEQAGYTVLRNQSAALPGNVNLIGADDLIWGTPDTAALVTEDAFNLLLCHEPDYARRTGGVQLQLSGHTHGLQINLPLRFYQDWIAPGGGQLYRAGLYEKEDGGLVYVTRGIGMSLLSLRFNAVPEITLVELRPVGAEQ